MRARWIVLPAVLALVVAELAAPPGPAAGGGPGVAATALPGMVTAAPSAGTAASTATYIAVSAGNGSTCAIRTDHTLTCWGAGGYGIPPAGTFTAVSAGGDHACAIRTDGTLACWGRDAWGESTPPTGVFTAVSAGEEHSCALRPNQTLACWGRGYQGSTRPPSGTFTAVSAGSYHACAIRTNGSLACWGDNSHGQTSPPAGTFRAVSAGGSEIGHTCAIRTNGSLACWGWDYSGQTSPPAGSFAAVDAGYAGTCAIRTDGTLACWGDKSFEGPPTGTFRTISTGSHGCAIRTEGTVACWGDMRLQPKVTLAALPPWLSTSRVSLSWSAEFANPPIASYELRYRRAPWNGSFGSWTTWLPETTATSMTYIASPGYTYCFSVRAWDTFGIASRWSTRCIAVPLDDPSLVRSSSWVAGTGTAYYRHTYLQGKFSGAKLTRSGVRAKQIALLATTCPTCGTVRIYWNSTLLKTVSLSSPTTQHKQLIPLASFSSVRTGTLTIRIVGGGKPVIIDGVAIRRS